MDLSSWEDASLITLIAAHTHGNSAVAPHSSQAIAALYDRYGRLVFSVAYHVTGDDNAAEEITQDVFLRVWNNAVSYDPQIARVNTWLVSITRNRAIDELRRRGARQPSLQLEWLDDLDQTLDQHPSDMQAPVERRLEDEALHNAIAALPIDQRKMVALAFFRGFSHQEIADQLGQPLGTVKSRIRLALQKLRNTLDENNMLE
ncbi:sigma-70 family RNA polymerase sigma factor [bacterium]|nr:MAG: sigma-70 family RNA polymerase sigma factor [bacterium]